MVTLNSYSPRMVGSFTLSSTVQLRFPRGVQLFTNTKWVFMMMRTVVLEGRKASPAPNNIVQLAGWFLEVALGIPSRFPG